MSPHDHFHTFDIGDTVRVEMKGVITDMYSGSLRFSIRDLTPTDHLIGPVEIARVPARAITVLEKVARPLAVGDTVRKICAGWSITDPVLEIIAIDNDTAFMRKPIGGFAYAHDLCPIHLLRRA